MMISKRLRIHKTIAQMDNEENMAKKKVKQETIATVSYLVEALNSAIGLADHAPDNEGKEFTFVIQKELFEVMGNPKLINTSKLPVDLTKALQDELAKKYITAYNHHNHIHEIVEASDDSDDAVWISVKVKINAILAIKTHNGFDYYRKA